MGASRLRASVFERGRTVSRNADVTVLVVGMMQPSAHAAARSLRRAGFDVIGACTSGRLAGRSRYLRKLFRISPSTTAQEFVADVRGICVQEGVAAVVPLADEMLGALIAEPLPSASSKIVGPPRAIFDAVCDKARLVAAAEQAGVLCPASVIVSPEHPLRVVPRLPAFVKVASGASDGRPAGRPVRVRTAEECELAVSAMVTDGRSVIVQEEIVGERWRVHFARSEGRTSHVSARTCADFPPVVGQSTISEFGTTPPALEAAAMRLLDGLQYEGIGTFGFLLRSGRWYVHDVNLRLPASVGGTIAAGLDLPRVGVGIALGRSFPPTLTRARPVRFVQLHGEIAALRTELAGRGGGRPAASVVKEVVLAAVLPGRMLEPLDVRDPLPTAVALASVRARTEPRDAAPPRTRVEEGL